MRRHGERRANLWIHHYHDHSPGAHGHPCPCPCPCPHTDSHSHSHSHSHTATAHTPRPSPAPWPRPRPSGGRTARTRTQRPRSPLQTAHGGGSASSSRAARAHAAAPRRDRDRHRHWEAYATRWGHVCAWSSGAEGGVAGRGVGRKTGRRASTAAAAATVLGARCSVRSGQADRGKKASEGSGTRREGLHCTYASRRQEGDGVDRHDSRAWHSPGVKRPGIAAPAHAPVPSPVPSPSPSPSPSHPTSAQLSSNARQPSVTGAGASRGCRRHRHAPHASPSRLRRHVGVSTPERGSRRTRVTLSDIGGSSSQNGPSAARPRPDARSPGDSGQQTAREAEAKESADATRHKTEASTHRHRGCHVIADLHTERPHAIKPEDDTQRSTKRHGNSEG